MIDWIFVNDLVSIYNFDENLRICHFLRLPDGEAATALRKAIESGASNLKERLFIQLEPDKTSNNQYLRYLVLFALVLDEANQSIALYLEIELFN